VYIILTVSQVAAWLHCSEAKVKKMVKLKEIPFIKFGKELRFILAELDDWFGIGV
jgi:excisionase family DNA binding protein